MGEAALPPLAITMGEPAGIGPDLIIQLFAQRHELSLPPFVVYGNIGFLAARARRLGIDVAFAATSAAIAADQFTSAMPVVQIDGLIPDKPGDTSPLSGKVVIEAISRAVSDTLTGACRGIVTGPIHKAALYNAGFRHPGHTEFLAALCSTNGTPLLPVMMLAHGDLRVVPLTIHEPLRRVPGLITADLLQRSARVLAHSLRTRFRIAEPRIAVAGLNPHAGERGTIGSEELDVIGPAVAQLAHEGMNIEGPIAADTLFYPPHWRQYDAAIAMYHDQGLIPIKTVAFEEAVNITLGLPFVRTSPDHGTALDLAGTGTGSMASFLAAIRVADTLTHAERPVRQAAQ